MLNYKNSINELTPKEVVQLLKDGNNRFSNNLRLNTTLYKYMNAVHRFPKPIAVIISCVDSRVPVSSIFDQSIGYIYNICIAGNSVTEDVISSLELVCMNNDIQVIIVIGHNECFAVRNACDNIHLQYTTSLLSKIRPAIFSTEGFEINRTSSNAEFISVVTVKHVELMVCEISRLSPFLRKKKSAQEISIIGGIYDIYTGIIDVLNL